MEINFDYLEWLKREVKLPKNHSKLADILLENYFYFMTGPEVYKDENRLEDGLYLRYTFSVDVSNGSIRENECVNTDKCTLLEFFVALSGRFSWEAGEDILSKPDAFRVMMSNLGIWMNNKEFDYEYCMKKLKFQLDRKYGKYGKGSIFPLKDPKCSSKCTELWVQMQKYVAENYDEDYKT